jgi:hypoxanthine-guanine phosphoribosyltransferase
VHHIFKQANVKQLKVATLFFKPEAYKDFPIDYVGISSNKFIVGFGLELRWSGRNLPIYKLKE